MGLVAGRETGDSPSTESSQEEVMFSFLLYATQLYAPESSSVTLLISRLLPPSSEYFLDLEKIKVLVKLKILTWNIVELVVLFRLKKKKINTLLIIKKKISSAKSLHALRTK